MASGVKTIADVWERDYWSKGRAVCQHDIIHDEIYCRYRDETFHIRDHSAQFEIINGMGPLINNEKRTMMHAKIKDLRKLKAAEAAKG